MHWLLSLDLGLLRFINETLSNPLFDRIMPFASGNRFFFPVVFLLGVALLWKGGTRGRLCVLMLALIVPAGDGLVCNTIKRAVARPRPFVTYPDIRQPSGRAKPSLSALEDKQTERDGANKPAPKSAYNSMPSSHAANWFAATMIFLVYYRRSLRLTLPLAGIVSFSRAYNGVHYPSDILAGAILGAGYAAAALWAFETLWHWAGPKWFPLWWQRQRSLLHPGLPTAASHPEIEVPHRLQSSPEPTVDSHWLRLGYILIAILFLVRLVYIASGRIELSEDEAYQWVWSKHLALSYYSKPPLIAYTQFLGTHLWGDTEFGVRFFSPVLSAVTSLALLRFIARLVSGRAAFVLLLIASTTPLLAVGSILMTIDPLSVCFWVLAMVSGWRAVQPDSKTTDWAWTGFWMGLGLLSKYTALLQWLCWVVFFLLWKPARQQLRRPGPYLALLINALCSLPIVIWNSQHHWITASHVADNAGLHGKWNPQFLNFFLQEFGLLNPIYFLAMIWAAVAFWRHMRNRQLGIYLFSMGGTLFLCYLLWSFHSRIMANWIAPSVLPLFCLTVLYWSEQWANVSRWAGKFLIFGVALGLITVVFLHESDFAKAIVGHPLPPRLDPMRRVRAWRESALQVDALRRNLEQEGKPAFIIGAHYGITGLFNFYISEATTNIDETLLAYCQTAERPKNQFFFWPGYQPSRKGQNAIFVRELPAPVLVNGWFWKWLKGSKNLIKDVPRNETPPPALLQEFETVKSLGQLEIFYRGDRLFHRFQIYECRNLR